MVDNNRITISEVIAFFWLKKLSFIKVTGIFALLGIIIAYTTPEEWTSDVELIPEISETSKANGGGALGKLAGLTGISLGNQTQGTVSPLLYPEILRSYVFKRAVLNEDFYFSTLEDTMTLEDFFKNHSNSPLVKKVLKGTIKGMIVLIKGEPSVETNLNLNADRKTELFFYTKEEKSLYNTIEQSISMKLDEMNGTVRISATIQDPIAAAMVVNFTQKYIASFVSDYNTEKATRKLIFLESQLKNAEETYRIKHNELAKFQDANREISSQMALSKFEQLRQEENLSFNLYSNLAQQVQEAVITVEEKKTVFTVLRPSSVPVDRSAPNRVAIFILSIALGLLLTSTIIFYKQFLRS
jgi:hypothetical protein